MNKINSHRCLQGLDTSKAMRWKMPPGSSLGLPITQYRGIAENALLIITATQEEARLLKHNMAFFSQADQVCFPDWETLPFDRLSPHAAITSERLNALNALQQTRTTVCITAVSTIMHRLIPPTALKQYHLQFRQGQELDLGTLEKSLIQAGYARTDTVRQYGEFARRGSILDIFPMGAQDAVRIDCFDDEIDSIRLIDIESQRSHQPQTAFTVLPAHEYPLDPQHITQFRQAWREQFHADPRQAPLYQHISEGMPTAGAEYYLPLFYDTLASIADYLPSGSQIIKLPGVVEAANAFWQTCLNRHEQYAHDIAHPLCDVSQCFLSPPQLWEALHAFENIPCLPPNTTKKAFAFPIDALPPLQGEGTPLLSYQALLPQTARVLICADSPGRLSVIQEKSAETGMALTKCDNWDSALQSEAQHNIIVAPLQSGFILKSEALWVITENDLYPAQAQQQSTQRHSNPINPDLVIKDLSELNINDPVVHIDHGVGRYLGLMHLDTQGNQAEFLHLAYANGDKIYVPIFNLHTIHRYTGANPESAPLHHLGSKQWHKEKQKALKKIHDVAAQLLDTYSQRQASTGFTFQQPDADFQRFRQAFPFEETPDQTRAIEQCIADMCSNKSMDRLICGDVGFGKTEIAMQAAFLAVQSHKQVAVLVPTTLLCDQHLKNFQERFAEWPIRIASLSRFTSSKTTESMLQGIATGQVDIVIATHKLLNPDIHFHNLGLLIVDEEQRFGTRQKERIKALKAHIDILTLTATPIPRTLNLALSGLRDLSLIGTPPAKRLAIKTTLMEWDKHRLREAMQRELMRGGQLFFLHNDIQTIEAMTLRIQQLMPEAKVHYAHGQMRERQLENIMLDFYHQRFHVLVSTTIIESGIDIPTANTIIINRADKLGLAQLHQLRGRVGRSHHQAYAYLITPSRKSMTGVAKRRMDAISQLDTLGAGFMLANHDLEIRGAGALLGEEQSGHIHHIGFTLYMDLLNEAVAALQDGQPLTETATTASPSCQIELPISTLLPDDYVADPGIRLTQYKRLSGCKDDKSIDDLQSEWIDRFGPLPDAGQALISLARLQCFATALGIRKIHVTKKGASIRFSPSPNIDFAKVIQLIQSQPKYHRLENQDTLNVLWKTDDTEKDTPPPYSQQLKTLLRDIQGTSN